MAPERAVLPFTIGSALAGLAPPRLGRPVVRRLGRAAAQRRSPHQRRLVRSHQRRAAAPGPVASAPLGADRRTRPGGDEVAEVYEAYARYWFESFRLPSLDRDAVATEFSFDGMEHVQRARARGEGVVLAMPHLGGWEWAAFWLAAELGYEVTAVVERLSDDAVFEWFKEFRTAFGVNVVPLGHDAGTKVSRALADGHVVALLGDRHVGGAGVDVDFFGEATTLPAGIATLGLRSGVSVVPTAVYFDGTGHFGHIRDPLPMEREGRFRDDVTRVTADLARELEALIRLAPPQWHLLGSNWPSDEGLA